LFPAAPSQTCEFDLVAGLSELLTHQGIVGINKYRGKIFHGEKMKVVDPVCKMTIEDKAAVATSLYKHYLLLLLNAL
jgi:hypothetical protein